MTIHCFPDTSRQYNNNKKNNSTVQAKINSSIIIGASNNTNQSKLSPDSNEKLKMNN